MKDNEKMFNKFLDDLASRSGQKLIIEAVKKGYRVCFEANESLANRKWIPCSKIEYNIQVYMPAMGTHVHNELENSDYVTNETKPFVLVGTQGEEWTVNAKKLMTAYKFDGSPITDDVIRDSLSDGKKHTITAIAGAEHMFATRVIDQVEVETSWGETLQANRPGIPHGNGDYIVCTNNNGSPNLDDAWVVNGLIFPKTYSMSVRSRLTEAGIINRLANKIGGKPEIANMRMACEITDPKAKECYDAMMARFKEVGAKVTHGDDDANKLIAVDSHGKFVARAFVESDRVAVEWLDDRDDYHSGHVLDSNKNWATPDMFRKMSLDMDG